MSEPAPVSAIHHSKMMTDIYMKLRCGLSVHLFLGGHLRCFAVGWKLRGQVPRQEFVHTVDRMIRDALKDMSQVELRIQIVEFVRAEQAVNGRCALAASI